MSNNNNYAKSLNQSVEGTAKITGDYFKTSWNKEAGYEGFAKGTLNNLAVLVLNNNLVILEQSNTSLKIKSKNLFGNLKNADTMYGITYTEFMAFMKNFMKK